MSLQLCQNIRQARLNKGLSQQKVADLLHEKRTTYANWEGETEPDLTKIRDISKVLDVPFDILVSGTVEAKTFQQARLNQKLNHQKDDDIAVYQAGTKGSFIDLYEDENTDVSIGSLNSSIFPGCNLALKVTGSSMYPMIVNQSVIVGERLQDPKGISSGEIYAVHTKRGLKTCKYVHILDTKPDHIKLVALSKQVPPQTIPIEDVVLLMRVYFIINPS